MDNITPIEQENSNSLARLLDRVTTMMVYGADGPSIARVLNVSSDTAYLLITAAAAREKYNA